MKLVNLLIGKNSCGKTSVFDALFLLLRVSNSALSVIVQKFIRFDNNFNVSNTSNVSAKITDNKERSLEFSLLIGLSEINNIFILIN